MGGTAIAVEDDEEGRITLSGFVDSDEARERAAELAAAQEGVTEVSNEIVVR